MILKIYRSPVTKISSIILVIIFLNELLLPSVLFALTSGPSTPEIQSFEPAGSTELVDLFSGDFTYNIPIFEVPGAHGGYPINLSYHSGIGMDQEASWVGLGWNINPGVINRNMRGFPDDFSGDPVVRTSDVKPNITYGLRTSGGVEVLGADSEFIVSLGLKVYYNNYKGVGYSLYPSFGYSGGNSGIGMGVDFSLDSQDGVGVAASTSMSEISNERSPFSSNGSVGISMNSRGSVDLNLSGQVKHSSKLQANNSLSISFAQPAYTPSSDLSRRTESLDIGSAFGIGFAASFAKFSLGGFYMEEYQLFRKEPIGYKAYGYNNLEHSTDRDLLDFNRSNDGIVRRESPNLAIPLITHDYYNICGQGLSTVFRPFRADFGTLHDPIVSSSGSGGSSGFETGIPFHYGGQGTCTGNSSTSGKWDDPALGVYKFRNQTGLSLRTDPVAYKANSEHTPTHVAELLAIGGEGPVRTKLEGNDINPAIALLEWWDGENMAVHPSFTAPFRNADVYGKLPQNTSVQPLSNDLIGLNDPILPIYDIKYYDENGSIFNLDRLTRNSHSIAHHIGGISALNEEGTRYVYGLPAYNLKDIDYTFSAPPASTDCGPQVQLPRGGGIDDINYNQPFTDEFFNKLELPPYAYSYHITSILGSDYVDVDGDGIDEDDMGYWVKFTYEKQPVFGWRSPFQNALFNSGWESTVTDNRGNFKYGEKEVYYLKSIETNSHKAIFDLQERSDASGIDLYGQTIMGTSKALNKIELYKKDENHNLIYPSLKKAHFQYSQELCGNLPNGSGSGKLTLKKLWFTQMNNTKGSLSPYEFKYDGLNPNYSINKYDRWGNYKPYDLNLSSNDQICRNNDFPYVDQFDMNEFQDDIERANFRSQVDEYSSVWNLTEIKLPSKANIKITYESDDYAYVQHRKAGQMFYITRTEGMFSQNQPDWKVYFKLEYPVPVGEGNPNDLISEYLADITYFNNFQLYFKVRTNLLQNLYEYVSGYVNLDMLPGHYGYDFSTIEVHNGIPYHTEAFVTLSYMDIDGFVPYHPFRVASWQHMRTDQPELMLTSTKLHAEPGTSDFEKEMQAQSLLSIIPELQKTFKGYRQYCFDRGFGSSIVSEKSVIRLTAPDGIKYGGGNRVKRIEFEDGWQALSGEDQAVYGKVYRYTIEEDGKTISSGVASYEPMMGGDEIPLRQAKSYPQNITMATNNNLFFQYPINEACFPAPSVGYRKVTVKSLATHQLMKGVSNVTKNVTGIQENNFYTAQEFPVITGETDIQKKYDNYTIPIPLIGQISVSNLTATQGYSILKNDMHGKIKSVLNYGFDDEGNLIEEPIQSTEYDYFKTAWYMRDGSNRIVWKTENQVPVVLPHEDYSDYGMGQINDSDYFLGIEYDFFNDSRESSSSGYVGGFRINTDIIIPPITIPTPWPTVIMDQSRLRTFTTNKIIYSSGILKEVQVHDGESMAKTENLAFDQKTGRPILTKVNNRFESPTYTYNIPAYWNYKGMEGSFENYLQVFNLSTSNTSVPQDKVFSFFSTDDALFKNLMQEGDGLILFEPVTGNRGFATITKCFEREDGSFEFELHSPSLDLIYGVIYGSLVVVPARKNMTSLDAGKIVSIVDPLSNVTLEQKPSQDISQTPDDFVEFLNNEVLQCDGTLRTDYIFDLNSSAYYTVDGFHKYPETKKLLDQLSFEHCNTLSSIHPPNPGYNHLCQVCDEIPGALNYSDSVISKQGYHINNIRFGGGAGPSSCECVAYKWDSYINLQNVNYTPITHFSQLNNPSKIQVNYSNRNPTEFCVFEPGQGGSIDPNFGTCWPHQSVTPEYLTCKDVIEAQIVTYSDDWDYSTPASRCSPVIKDNNPYSSGKRGIWRVKKQYHYEDNRSSSKTAPNSLLASVSLSTDGVYSNENITGAENSFYFFNWKPSLDRPIHERWEVENELTRCDRNGFEVESKDILGNFSSIHYNNSTKEIIDQSKNAGYYEVLASNAEADNSNFMECLTANGQTNSDYSHTGQKSWHITPSVSQSVLFESEMQPLPNKEYFVSMWVYYPNSSVEYSYNTNGIGLWIQFRDQQGNLISKSNHLKPIGNIVENWQKIEGTITAPISEDLNGIALEFSSDLSSDEYYIDDIRITPFNGVSKSYVYTKNTGKIKAILDENNFAKTFYYNEQDDLYLIKQETTKGLFSVSESRKNIAR